MASDPHGQGEQTLIPLVAPPATITAGSAPSTPGGGAPTPTRGAGSSAEQRWLCHVCGNINLAFREVCNMKVCQAPRGFPGPYHSFPDGTPEIHQQGRQWVCAVCGEVNRAGRSHGCFRRGCDGTRQTAEYVASLSSSSGLLLPQQRLQTSATSAATGSGRAAGNGAIFVGDGRHGGFERTTVGLPAPLPAPDSAAGASFVLPHQDAANSSHNEPQFVVLHHTAFNSGGAVNDVDSKSLLPLAAHHHHHHHQLGQHQHQQQPHFLLDPAQLHQHQHQPHPHQPLLHAVVPYPQHVPHQQFQQQQHQHHQQQLLYIHTAAPHQQHQQHPPGHQAIQVPANGGFYSASPLLPGALPNFHQ